MNDTILINLKNRPTPDSLMAKILHHSSRNHRGCLLWEGHQGAGATPVALLQLGRTVSACNVREILFRAHHFPEDFGERGTALRMVCGDPACITPDHARPLNAPESRAA